MKLLMLFIVALSGFLFAQKTVVTPLGPDGGIISVLSGSLNDDVVIAAVQDHGLYRSTDGGNSWNSIISPSLSASGLRIYDIVFHPFSSDTVFLPTSNGLFRSNDKGVTFSPVTTFPTPQFSIDFSLANPSVIFGSDKNGPLRSVDGGKNWSPLKDNVYFGNRQVNHMAVHPSDTGNSIRVIASVAIGDTAALFFSNNSGASWRPFNKGLPTGNARHIYRVEIDSMAIGKINFRAVIGTADGIYGAQSDKFDTAWTSLKSNNIPSSGVITSGMLVYDKLDPTAPLNDQHKFALYYASNASEFDGTPVPFTEKNGLFKISSKYNSFFTLPLLEPPPVQRVFSGLGDITSVFIPSNVNKSKIYLGTSNGIFISTDDGVTWQRKNNGIAHSMIRNIVSLPSDTGGNVLFSAIYGGGVMRSTDEGTTWSAVYNGLASPYVVSLDADTKENILYAGTSLSLYRTVDRGKTWIELFKIDSSMLLRPSRFTNNDHEITVRHSPVKSTNILVKSSAAGMWMSMNGGGTWNRITLPFSMDSSSVPESIEFDPFDASTIYYAAYGLFKSTNAGQSWTDISSNLPKSAVNPATQSIDAVIGLSPAVNPQNTNEIFLATTFKQGEGIPYRVFKTTNGGTSWDPLPIILPAYDILYDRLDPRRLAASGPKGIYRTTTGGSSWSRVTDSASSVRYFLLGEHHANSNVFYSGSGQGAFRIELNEYPQLTVDTLQYDFGSILLGTDSVRNISFKNISGKRNVLLTFLGLSDTNSFHYAGVPSFSIDAGMLQKVALVYSPVTAGEKTAVLRMKTTDPAMPLVQIVLRGHSFSQYPFEKFSYSFGSVTVDRDTVIAMLIPNQSRQKIALSLIANSDSVNYSIVNTLPLIIDTGAVGTLLLRFRPKSAGDHTSILQCSTTDPKFPVIQLKLFGTGILRTFLSRKIMIDTSFGRFIDNDLLISDYYGQLRNVLMDAGLNVALSSGRQYADYHSLVIVQPATKIVSPAKDALQLFVASGGTLVLISDYRDSSARIFNSFLQDPEWSNRYGVSAGVQFGRSLLFDSVLVKRGIPGAVVSVPAVRNRFTVKVDSLISSHGTYLSVDTSKKNTTVLFRSRSKALFINDSSGIIRPFTDDAVIAASSTVGRGRIIAVGDPDIWRNGTQEDTADPFGIYGAGHLQLALNIFGSIENLPAELRETVEERYELISIPFAFDDSSVTSLFKDLGENNSYLWRMFGKYNALNGYQEYPAGFTTIERGQGYWLITKEKRKIKLGTISLTGTPEDFEITVNPGFTMIGNPFPYAVSWKNSFVPDSVQRVIWSYNEGAYDSTTVAMEPFKGYWIFNRAKTRKTVRINAAPIAVTTMPKSGLEGYAEDPGDWKIRLSLISQHGSDPKNFIGVLNDALDGWDNEDFVKPPASPSANMALSITNLGERLSADYRAHNSEGHVWNFTVTSTDPGAPLQIQSEQIGNVPDEFNIYLIDLTGERMYDLRTIASYDFAMAKKEQSRSFRIVAGTQAYLDQHSDGIPVIPMEYSLSQNYPNPFNPVTTIRYSLSNSGTVDLKIFNVLGQNVRTLVSEHQQIGSYSVTWDGKDNHGILLSSGIYYYQIQANNYRSVKKMTFIK